MPLPVSPVSPTLFAPPERVDIQLGERSYPILIGAGLLSDPESFAATPAAASALIVSNTTVAPLYAKALHAVLAQRFRTVHLLELPDGEVHKNLQTLNLIFDALLGHG
ncbi:MAG: 3-dehydroquinate synthase, partial [Frankiales bacterium]|nr:3-dehydroquinate synthase [Frankiales bacterium]